MKLKSKSVEWLYHRKNCQTCARAQDFFVRNKIEASETVDARKERIGPADALKLARKMDNIYVTKGKNVLHFDMKKEKPDEGQLSAAIIGPSGNLRAPAMVLDRTMIVGFDETTYERLLT